MKTAIISLLVSSLLLTAGCYTNRATKWEYQMVHTIGGINERTDQGWTVDSFVVKPDGSHDYLLKKPKP